MAVNPGNLLPTIFEGHDRLLTLVAALTDDTARGPSALPGWSRAHVLSHIEGVSLALARQARFALRGELIDPYDGGRPARDAAIEAGASRSAKELTYAVGAALAQTRETWSAVGPQDRGRAVRYRDADVAAVLAAWWRELGIHTADADLGYGSSDWSRDFCGHVLDHLAPRTPEGIRLELTAVDGPDKRVLGSGETVVVRGALTDLTAWMAGREPAGTLAFSGAEVPELGPWP
ncbi:maleylpyruvate isomerase family mycothiol-dependent enzyme [Streptomyces sp. NPDC059373]